MNETDSPIYEALWVEKYGSPIYDQLLQAHDSKKYEELTEPYRYPLNEQRVFTLEEFNNFLKSLVVPKKEKTMNKWQELVNEFREAMDLPVPDAPRQLTGPEAERHIQMIRDEFEKELVPALRDNDLVALYDAGIDVLVYVIGAMSNAGLDLDPGFVEVMRSNMTKMDPETKKAIRATFNDPSGEPEGKILKGPYYEEPKLGIIINEQSMNGWEDKRVWRNVTVPLTFGVGGPQIGEGEVNMDNNGNLIFEGRIDVETTIPVLDQLGYQVSALSIGSETVVPPVLDIEEVKSGSQLIEEALAAGRAFHATADDKLNFGVVEDRSFETGINYNDVAYLDVNGKERSTKMDREEAYDRAVQRRGAFDPKIWDDNEQFLKPAKNEDKA